MELHISLTGIHSGKALLFWHTLNFSAKAR
jgi:hypothetical protein